MCCNGVIFADVRLRRAEDPSALEAAGIEFVGRRLPQPCPALDGCACKVYAIRPRHCRAFDCQVLLRVKAAELSHAEGLRLVRRAQRSVQKIEGILARLGDSNVRQPLAARFRIMAARMEQCPPLGAKARDFARLTAAMHELNVQLSRDFYPG